MLKSKKDIAKGNNKCNRLKFVPDNKLKFSIKKSAYLKYANKDILQTIPKIKIDLFENIFLLDFSFLVLANVFPIV